MKPRAERFTDTRRARGIGVVCALLLSTGVTWAALPASAAVAAPTPTILGGPGTQTVIAVTAVDGGFVAVGRETPKSTEAAAAWRGDSTGTRWTRLAAPETLKLSGTPSSSASGVATGDTGTVVGVGQELETPANPKPGGYPGDALFWRSKNGRALQLASKQTHEGDLSYRADAVAFGDGSFAAVGNSFALAGNPGCEAPLAWYSTDDGRSWTGAELAIPAGSGGTVHAVTWSSAFGFVAVGETYPTRCEFTTHTTAALWTSKDGATWTLSTSTPDAFSLRGVTATAHRLVMVGAGPNEDAGLCAATYWSTDDLDSWSNTAADSTQITNGVTALADDSFIAVGSTCSSSGGGHAVAYTSSDASHWALVHLAKPSSKVRNEMLAAAPRGARAWVIVGSQGTHGAVWRP